MLELPRVAIEDLVRRALVEDLGAGDLTTESCIDAEAPAAAAAVARGTFVHCGAFVARVVFETVDRDLRFESCVREGERIEPKATLWRVTGRARSILMGERVALNLVQRMCGIATLTRSYVDARTPASKTRIVDTRKTTPGLRVLERYAVRMGGGHNHRDNLSSAILIKDNHIVAAGGIQQAIERARERAPHTTRIECEVTNFAELETALTARADIIMLDNMDNAAIEKAIAITNGRAILEASGGITLSRISALSKLGVDVVSVGALTHSVTAVDIGLDFDESFVASGR
jgi:nicotinate-nucleotide pyrophosphorylase (carboxylating)